MSAGYERDRFIFKLNGQKYVRYYGDRYDNEQAITLFTREIKQAGGESGSLF